MGCVVTEPPRSRCAGCSSAEFAKRQRKSAEAAGASALLIIKGFWLCYLISNSSIWNWNLPGS